MTKLTCFGGVSQIGGNKFLIESNGTRILMDFGMNFAEEGKFFDEYMGPRTCNSLADMSELGMLPKIEGLYRRDYAKHMGFGGNEDTSVDAVLLTHAHIDHVGDLETLKDQTGAEVLLHEKDLKLYQNLPMQAAWLGVSSPATTKIDHFIHEGDYVSFGRH